MPGLAKRNGYVLRKLRPNVDLDNLGQYMLIDAKTNAAVRGSRFDAGLEGVAQSLGNNQNLI